MAFKFEELRVWQKSVELTEKIDCLTRDFPKEEKFVLTSQIKRAADSIALNIAEGSTGQSTPEFKRFLGFSIRSGIEVIACLHLGRKRGIIQEDVFKKTYAEVESLIIMTQALRKSLK